MKKFSISVIFLLLSISATADYPDFSDLVDEAAPAVVNVSVIKTISTQNRMSPFNRRQNPFDDFFNYSPTRFNNCLEINQQIQIDKSKIN